MNNEEEHLDSNLEINLETVKARAVKGVVVLTGRTFLLSVLSLISMGLLTVLLNPADFGVFWVVSAVVNFFTYFSDVGLAAALIQKKEKLTDDDLRTTFTIQQIMVLAIVLIIIFLSPVFSQVYNLSFQGKFLMYALGFSLLLSSLKTIPSVLLERKLEFGKLVIPQVLENLVYNFVVVILAWRGFGIMSFTYAVLARGIVGLVGLYVLSPWVPGIAFNKESLKKLLSFGVPYQVNTLLATLKDDGMTMVLGKVLGTAGIGYLGWAQKWGQTPLRFFMDHVLKVTFPAFARMQDEKEHLRNSVTRSIFFICFLVFPSLMAIAILAPILITIIPRYGKWTPALIPLGFIMINSVFAAVSTQLTNLLNAIGKIKTTFKLMIMWVALSWLFIPILSIKFGVNGAALGYALVGASSIIPIIIVKRIVDFSLIESALKPFVASLAMGAAMFLSKTFIPSSTLGVVILVIIGGCSYLAISYVIYGVSMVTDIKKSFSAFFTK